LPKRGGAKLSNFTDDLNDSIRDFNMFVIPQIQKNQMIEGKIIQVESNNPDELRDALDVLGGIDAWKVSREHGMQGISSRIQWGKSWDTFTIRKTRHTGIKTEYAKRNEAISSGNVLYPTLAIHAYITRRERDTSRELISLAIADTDDIFDLINRGYCFERENPDDGNIFTIVSWDELVKQNKNIQWWHIDQTHKLRDYSNMYKEILKRAKTRSLFEFEANE